ncbi:MAG: hypothetical protein QXW97_03755 [Candidatus Pacearchaeota archaeon]
MIGKKREKKFKIGFYLDCFNIFSKSKHSQITIFIILALAIVVVLLLILMQRENFRVILTQKAPIDLIRECSLQVLDDSVNLISSQGGSINPQNYYLYNGTKIEYLCYNTEYYKNCIMQKPLLKQSIEKEIKKEIEPKIVDCFRFQKDELEKKGYNFIYKNPVINVSIIPNNIKVTIDSDLKISKKKTESYKTIKILKSSELYDLIMIANSILNLEARYGESEIMSYMIFYPNLRVEKKKQDEGTNIYILTDKNTQDKFVFASRSFAIPSGVTGK